MSERYKTIMYDVSKGIAAIQLNRPPVNVIDEAMTLEYFDALDRADGDNSVKVIVRSGSGKGLSAGVDIRYLEEFGANEMARFLEIFYVEQVERVPMTDEQRALYEAQLLTARVAAEGSDQR